QAPPSPDYIPGPEEPEQAPPSPYYIPGLEHADDEIVAEDQPYAEDDSPNAQSPEYVLESDLEVHPEDDDDEDPEEDPINYLADGGDDGDDEEGISIPAPIPMPAWSDSEIVRLLAMSSLPASPLSPWSSPLPRIPFPPLPLILSPPSPAASTSHSPPLQLPSASRTEDRPEVTLPPQKRLGIAFGPRYEVGESSSAAAARPTGVETLQGAPVSTDTELGGYMREFETRVRQDTDEIYMRRQTVVSELLRTDHRRSTEITELRTAIQGQVTALQGHVTALQAQVTTLQGQQGLA
nr:hypothetical protein [Tanacetum cinerariifolium]